MRNDGESEVDVSVLLPTNRDNAWLDLAVRSILSQQDVRMELVIIRDGVDMFAPARWGNDQRVRQVVAPKGAGLARVLNAGFRHARGHLIARMDGDDIALPGRLARQVEFLHRHEDVVLLGTTWKQIDSEGRIVGDCPIAYGPESTLDLRYGLLKRNVLGHPTVMMRRWAVQQVGGYNEECLFAEDYELWLRLAAMGRVAVLLDELLLYRRHPGQMSDADSAFSKHTLKVLTARQRLAAGMGVSRSRQIGRDLEWFIAQVLRTWGWR